MLRTRILLLLAAAAVIAAQAGYVLRASEPSRESWPHRWLQYQAGPAHNAVFPGTLRANWARPLGDKINGGLALVDGTLYAVSFDRKLYAIDPATGSVRWSVAADNILMSTPIVANDLVIAGSGKDGFLKPTDAGSQVWGRDEGDDIIAFSPGGRRLWNVHTVGDDMPSGAIDGGTLFFANGDAHAYAYDLQSVKQRWQTDLPGIPTMASATLAHGSFFTSVCHNAPYFCRTIAMNERDGRIQWSSTVGGSDCTPTVDGGLVFVESSGINVAPYNTGGSVTVAALDERSGKTRWSKTFPAAPYTYVASSERQIAATASGGVLYQAIGNLARVVAFEERSGRLLWTAHTSGNVKMSPVIKGNRVYFGDTAGILYSVDRSSGRIVHTASFLQPFSVAPPIVFGKTIFVASGSIVLAIPLDTL